MMPDLEDLWDEMQRGRIYECSLRTDQFRNGRPVQFDGLLDGECIYVDPRPAIIETLLHELLHRRKPRLGERTVTNYARKLALAMDEPTKRRWWAAYRRVRRTKPPVNTEDE
jgi:hypothetical protein